MGKKGRTQICFVNDKSKEAKNLILHIGKKSGISG
jgi:hypothetical protein